MAFPNGWSHRWPIAINADSVITSPVSAWPCHVTDVHFPAAAWAQMNADASDLRFSSDEAGTVELYYDAPRISVAGQSAHLYVQVPTLASTKATTIWAWVGNAEATAPSAAWMQNTYPSDIAGWYAMQEGTGATVYDRTANARHGTAYNAPTWTQAADGSWYLAFEATSSQYVDLGSAYSFGANPFTVASRIICSNLAPIIAITSRSGFATGGYEFMLGIDSTPGRVGMRYQDTSAKSLYVNGLGDGAWRTFMAVATADTMTLRISGSAVGSAARGTITNSQNLMIARRDTLYARVEVGPTMLWSRAITDDESALHDFMLSAPATFAQAGELVAVGGGAVPMIYRAARRRSRTLIPGMVVLP